MRIAILGWAFKANTNDSRESASLKVKFEPDFVLKCLGVISMEYYGEVF